MKRRDQLPRLVLISVVGKVLTNISVPYGYLLLATTIKCFLKTTQSFIPKQIEKKSNLVRSEGGNTYTTVPYHIPGLKEV
jgi:hypothetical protein